MQYEDWIHITHKDVTLMCDNDGVIDSMSCMAYGNIPTKVVLFSIIYYNDEWTLHNTSKPAYKYADGRVVFLLYGKMVEINELPCDDETKCMLTLKYTKIADSYMYH